MQCPFCNYDNIEGVDECERCNAALTDLADLEVKSEIELDLLRRPLGDLIAQDYATVPPDLPVREVVQQLHNGGHHCAVVLKDDGIVGIFTERDILQKLADQFDSRADAPVNDYMTPDRAAWASSPSRRRAPSDSCAPRSSMRSSTAARV